MFNPSRNEVRDLFFRTWEKYRSAQVLEGLESTVLTVILQHPEYHALLAQRDHYLERDYRPESGELNPFLHMSLHLSVEEQLAVDQPPGICALFGELTIRSEDRHEALHTFVECLGETVWQANRAQSVPDTDAYLDCIARNLGKSA